MVVPTATSRLWKKHKDSRVVAKHLPIAAPCRADGRRSQADRLVAIETRIIPREELALQPVCLEQDISKEFACFSNSRNSRNPFTALTTLLWIIGSAAVISM